MINNNLIYIAKITKPHGIKGQVKIMSYTATPKDLFSYPVLYDENLNEYKLKRVSEVNANLFIASFNHNTSRNLAEDIAGLKLYITTEMLRSAEDNEYYHHDLVNLKVLDSNKVIYGKIIEVHNFGAGDIIEVQLNNAKSSTYLPFNEQYIKEINIKEGFLIFDFESSGITA